MRFVCLLMLLGLLFSTTLCFAQDNETATIYVIHNKTGFANKEYHMPIFINGVLFAGLHDNQYFVLRTEKSRTKFAALSNTSSYSDFFIETEPGKTYYLLLRLGIGFSANDVNFTLLNYEEAVERLKGCNEVKVD